MKTTSELLEALLLAGFSRNTILSIARENSRHIALARLGKIEFSERKRKRLLGLLRWMERTKNAAGFPFQPAMFFENQMIVVDVSGEDKYSSFSELYDKGLADADTLADIALAHPVLLDPDAFEAEHPFEAHLTPEHEGDTVLVGEHDIPAIDPTDPLERKLARRALDEMAEESRECRRSWSLPPVPGMHVEWEHENQ